jgi:hypothetical protein
MSPHCNPNLATHDAVGTGNAWSFHNSHAELLSGAISARVDVTHPELGVNHLTFDSRRIEGMVLGVRAGDRSAPMADALASNEFGKRQWCLADAYVRAGDLVATYQPTDDWPYSAQIYWKATDSQRNSDQFGSLSLLVSLQTHLLDTWPTIFIETRLVANEVLYLTCDDGQLVECQSLQRGDRSCQPTSSESCVLQRLAGAPISYVEIMPASDIREIVISRGDDGGSCARWELFADFLEKGVIRRARMQSVIVPRDDDVQHAVAACAEIGRRPLPLTT